MKTPFYLISSWAYLNHFQLFSGRSNTFIIIHMDLCTYVNIAIEYISGSGFPWSNSTHFKMWWIFTNSPPTHTHTHCGSLSFPSVYDNACLTNMESRSFLNIYHSVRQQLIVLILIVIVWGLSIFECFNWLYVFFYGFIIYDICHFPPNWITHLLSHWFIKVLIC